MPGAKRNVVGRTGSFVRSSNVSSANINGRSNSGERASTNGAEDKRLDEIYGGRSLAPKHIPIPAVPVDGQLGFEALSFVVSIIAACLQLLNLYRTVWWLPNSYNGYTMNFYLIDPYLVVFIFTTAAYRFLYMLLRQIIDVSLPIQLVSAKLTIRNIIRSSLLVVVKSVLGWSLYHMIEKHNSMKIFYLCYPPSLCSDRYRSIVCDLLYWKKFTRTLLRSAKALLLAILSRNDTCSRRSLSVYFVMFGIQTTPFSDISYSSENEERKTKYVLDKPLHNCSLNASAIRAEVYTLRLDFNRRLKQALFSSSASVYVCVVAPIIFVPPYLHFNVMWVVQHVILFWLGRICAYFAQVYPFRYCDELHRAAMHLGRWVKIENRNNHIYAEPWNETILWSQGSIVSHNQEVYRSEGLCTAAEPGNLSHSRFYGLFNNRVTLLSPILALQLLLVNIQLFILLGVTEWYQILSTILLLIIHYYTLFKMARDFLVSWKVYRAEQIIQEKFQTVVNSVAQ
ncbi:Transmembrane protein 39A [Cyphomyrmex costatus]|uniref:Transmembrane protein 39A n=1 Tax=Cyphomyrmex costatus TaxID=456900 RepID=A0A151IP66_9HYME|nr:Transmembrane protein 39A [Cyphomyrmex costatus]